MKGLVVGWGWWLAALCALVATPALADPQRVSIDTCIASAASPLLRSAAAALARPDRFACGGRQQRFGSGDFWVRSRALPASAGIALDRVRSGSLWQRRTTLFARYADGHVARLPIEPGHERALIQLGATIEQPLPHRGTRVTDLLWLIEGSPNNRGILAKPMLFTAAASAEQNVLAGALYAGFAGLCLALLVYNFALWVAVRHRFQLAYCAMVATLLCYAITASGALMWCWPALANNDRIRIGYLTLAASGASAMWFARSFFEPRIFAGWLGRATTAVSVAIVATAILYVATAPSGGHLIDRLHGSTFAAQLLLTLPIGAAALRHRSRFLIPFATAWSGAAMMAAIRVINTFQLLSQTITIGQNVILLMTAEVLLSSLAIAYRIYLLGRERDEARTQEIAARLLADTDPLTGLMNRRSFLDQAVGRQGPQLLLIADLDHFKEINDTIGHDGGDDVLRGVARALAAALPPGTLAARIGGEEFAVVAAADGSVTARLLVDALRRVRMPFDLSITASIGTCTGPLASEADWKRLYRQADQALYEAKNAGRDRVRDAGALPLAA